MSIRVDKNPKLEGPTDPEKRRVWLEHHEAAKAEGFKAREAFRRDWASSKPSGGQRMRIVAIIVFLVGVVAFVVVNAVRN